MAGVAVKAARRYRAALRVRHRLEHEERGACEGWEPSIAVRAMSDIGQSAQLVPPVGEMKTKSECDSQNPAYNETDTTTRWRVLKYAHTRCASRHRADAWPRRHKKGVRRWWFERNEIEWVRLEIRSFRSSTPSPSLLSCDPSAVRLAPMPARTPRACEEEARYDPHPDTSGVTSSRVAGVRAYLCSLRFATLGAPVLRHGSPPAPHNRPPRPPRAPMAPHPGVEAPAVAPWPKHSPTLWILKMPRRRRVAPCAPLLPEREARRA